MAPRRLAALASLALLAGCGGLTLPDGSAARQWGDGPYGLVLVHDADRDAASWDAPAQQLAEEGMTVVAVEEDTAAAVEAAIEHLHAAGVERVAVLAAGSGADAALAVGRDDPQLIDQLIALSADGDATELGVFPKLFVASDGEAAAAEAERMVDEAPGDWNALYLAPGGDSGQAILSGSGGEAALEAIILRLAERR
jgi:hypothetical protein